jgi:perosamine synthetase
MNTFIPISQPSIGEKEVAYVSDCVRSGWVSSLGRYIEEFERSFATYCSTRFALSVSNGTTGLHLALVAAGVKAGDEVIVPDLTFIATANAVSYIGARPVLVDVDRETLCISPNSIERAITPKTRAVIPVHLYGHPADMDAIRAVTEKRGLLLVEDAAEAHGAVFRGRRVGGLGLCGVFSFYGNKIITSGEGGMITTNDEKLYIKAKSLRDHAMSPTRRYWHDEVGYNYRMTNMQAALGVAQLERIEEFLEKRRTIMAWYRQRLSGVSGVVLNREASWARNVFWMVCVEIDGQTDVSRGDLMNAMRAQGVDSRPFFYPISDMPMFHAADTPIAHEVSRAGLNLPTYFDMTEHDVDRVCDVFRASLFKIGR